MIHFLIKRPIFDSISVQTAASEVQTPVQYPDRPRISDQTLQKFETNDSTCQTQTDVPVRTRVEVFARASQTSEIEKYSKKTGTKILVHEMDTQTRSNRNMNENTQTVAVKSDSIGIQTDSGIESAGSDNEGRDQISSQQFILVTNYGLHRC